MTGGQPTASEGAATPILGGRWQPPHLGHVWLVEHILQQCPGADLVLGIVNPDPAHPPDPGFRKFLVSDNPLTYWERASIWVDILSALNVQERVAIVPMWHPRKSLSRENAYLPPRRQRYWVVPLLDEEERAKAEDFHSLEEDVKIVEPADIPDEISRNHSFDIRRLILARNEEWRRDVPSAVAAFFDAHRITDRVRRLYESEMHLTRFERL